MDSAQAQWARPLNRTLTQGALRGVLAQTSTDNRMVQSAEMLRLLPTHANDDCVPSNFFKQINALKTGEVQDIEAIEHARYADGPVSRIVKSKAFEYTTFGVIILNAAEIGADVNYKALNPVPDNLYEGPLFFILAECFFAAYFSVEIILRFIAYNIKLHALRDGWFVFDSILVCFMVLETWVLPATGASGHLKQLAVFRLLRLGRITRMARLMRQVPQLMIIVKGMMAAIRAVGWIAALLLMLTYAGAILFTGEYHEGLDNPDPTERTEQLFGTMGKSMMSLFVMGTILDDITFCTDGIRKGPKAGFMLAGFLLFVLISSFMMLNMLLGVLAEVVGNSAEGHKKTAKEEQTRVAFVQALSELTHGGTRGMIRKDFEVLRTYPPMAKVLEDYDIQDRHLKMYADLIWADESTEPVSFTEVLETMTNLQPHSHVSAMNFGAVRKVIRDGQMDLKERLNKLQQEVAVLCSECGLKSSSSLWDIPRFSEEELRSLRARPPTPSTPPMTPAPSLPGLVPLEEDATEQALSSSNGMRESESSQLNVARGSPIGVVTGCVRSGRSAEIEPQEEPPPFRVATPSDHSRASSAIGDRNVPMRPLTPVVPSSPPQIHPLPPEGPPPLTPQRSNWRLSTANQAVIHADTLGRLQSTATADVLRELEHRLGIVYQ